jgi:hypothetical protein
MDESMSTRVKSVTYETPIGKLFARIPAQGEHPNLLRLRVVN